MRSYLREKSKSNHKWIVILILIIIMLGVGYIFVANNKDLLLDSKKEKNNIAIIEEKENKIRKDNITIIPKNDSKKEEQKKTKDSFWVNDNKNIITESKEKICDSSFKTKDNKELKSDLKNTLSVSDSLKYSNSNTHISSELNMLKDECIELSNIRFKLIEGSKPWIKISLGLYFKKNDELKKEILLKKENFRVLIIKNLSQKPLKEFKSENLKSEIIIIINNILEKGKLSDISFKEFLIER